MDGEGVIFHLFSNFFMESILGVGGKENQAGEGFWVPENRPTPSRGRKRGAWGGWGLKLRVGHLKAHSP